jgi:hypothetical protein
MRRPGSPAAGFRPPAGDAKLVPFLGRPGHFLLLAQEKVTKEKGPPDDAPYGLRPPGARVGYGVFRQGILPGEKTGRHPCRPPCGLILHPPAASYGVPQEPRAEAKSCRSTVGAHPVRDKPTERYIPAGRPRPGPAPTDKRPDRGLWCAKANAQRGSALSPEHRLTRDVAIPWIREIVTIRAPNPSGLVYRSQCELLRPFSLGYFSLGPAREK